MRDTIFGLKIILSKWGKEDELPLFVSSSYDFNNASLDGNECLLLSPRKPYPSLREMFSHISEIGKIEELPVVFYFESVNEYRRNIFIDNRIAFISEKQAYLPFIGAILLKEKEKEKKRVVHLTFSAQLLILYYITSGKDCLYMRDATGALHYSPMTISRALEEIKTLGFFDVFKDGVNNVMRSKLGRRELFCSVREYMSSPVLKTCFLDKTAVSEDMVVASENALGEKTMLSPPDIITYAVDRKKVDKRLLMDEFFDERNQVKLEIWAYNPLLLSRDSYPDSLSLVLSLLNKTDERVEEAVEELINREIPE